MYLVPFVVVDPDLAARETRVLTLFKPRDGIPVGSYGLLESYCPDPDCDCQRVMINVAEEKRPTEYLASIGYGFDRDAEDAGPYLDSLNRQCRYAEDLLRLVEELALSNPRYVARLKRHYAFVKRAVADPNHAAYHKLQEAIEWEEDEPPVRVPGPEPQRVGRNDPCPCGSGKKYKRCCGRRGRRNRVEQDGQASRIDGLIDKLVQSREWPHPQLLADILSCGESAVKPLMSIIRDPEMYWDRVQDKPRRTPEFAMGLLGDLRAQAAIPELIELFYWEHIEDRLELVADTLARIGPAAVELAKLVFLDRALDWYPRALAASVLVVQVYKDPDASQELLQFLRDLLRSGPLESPEDRIVYALLAQDLADVQGMDALDVIEAAYRRDAIDREYTDWPDAETMCRNAAPDLIARYTVDFMPDYRTKFGEKDL